MERRADHVTRAEFDGLKNTVETLRVSREARLQSIEYHLERIVALSEMAIRFAPWCIGFFALLQVGAIWIGLEGWRRP